MCRAALASIAINKCIDRIYVSYIQRAFNLFGYYYSISRSDNIRYITAKCVWTMMKEIVSKPHKNST